MDKNDTKLINLLIDLKTNFGVIGVKAEFEDEGASFDEVSHLKMLIDSINLSGNISGLPRHAKAPLAKTQTHLCHCEEKQSFDEAIQGNLTDLHLGFTLKIGGSGALNDLNQAKKLGVSTIVAPMIESAYALKKFVQSVDSIYESAEKPKLFINIETINGYKKIDEICECEEFSALEGVVLGRFDMSKSLGGGCNECDSEQLFKIASDLSLKCQNFGKKFVIGGGIKEKSLLFLKQVPYLSAFETRKIVFDAEKVIMNNDFHAIINAIEFEIAWLESKGNLGEKNISRINALRKRTQRHAEFISASHSTH